MKPTRAEIEEAIMNGDRHPVEDADDMSIEGLDWVSFYHNARDGGHIAVNYTLSEVESYDGEQPTPDTVYDGN